MKVFQFTRNEPKHPKNVDKKTNIVQHENKTKLLAQGMQHNPCIAEAPAFSKDKYN